MGKHAKERHAAEMQKNKSDAKTDAKPQKKNCTNSEGVGSTLSSFLPTHTVRRPDILIIIGAT